MEKEREERTRERGENKKNNKIRAKNIIASKNVLFLQCKQRAERKVYCFIPQLYCDIYRTNPVGVLYSAPTSDSMFYFTVCSPSCPWWCLDCGKFYPEVVIRAKLSCGVYLSGVNTLQGNEGGQEKMAATQQGWRRTGWWRGGWSRGGGGGWEDCLQLVHQSTVGEQHGDSWGGEGTMWSCFEGICTCVSVCVCK